MESLVFLVIMFLVGGVLQSLGQKNKERRRHAPAPGPTPDDDETAEAPKDILQAIREAMEQAERRRRIEPGASRPIPPHRPKALPPRRQTPPLRPPATTRRPEPEAEDLFEEEGQSLETEPQVTSLETPEIRRERPVVDRDDEIEEVVKQRVRWAEEHGHAVTPADHRAFDQRIRPAAAGGPSQPTAAARRPRFDLGAAPAARLRELIVWQEILGKPRSLREDR